MKIFSTVGTVSESLKDSWHSIFVPVIFLVALQWT